MNHSRLANLLYWNVERGSVPYDLLCLVLVLVILLVSPCWLGDPMAVCP